MKKIFAVASALLALSISALGTAHAAPISYHTTNYRCDAGRRVSVKQVNVDQANFVVVTYKGQQYALAPAVSASGIRYVGMVGQTMNTGLEWVEWHGQGFLNSFPVSSPDHTRKVLANCKALR